jgi:branched-chain amino acid transport system permease protein
MTAPVRMSIASPLRRRDGPHWVFWIPILGVLILAGAVPFFIKSSFFLTIASQIGVAVIFALSFNLMFGVTGMLWFAQAIFYGGAAYAVIYLLRFIDDYDITFIPVPVIPLAGAVFGLAIGAIVGAVVTKRAGLVFAMISLGISELVQALCYIFISLSGGEQGLSADRAAGPAWFGLTFGSQIQIYYLILVWCVISLVAYSFFMRTPLGRIALAAKENPERVSFIGYNLRQVRWILFTISAGVAGVAGALHALNYEHVGTTTLGLETSGLVIFMVVIGGTGNAIGPILGAALITLLYGVVGNFTSAWVLYVGLLFVLVVTLLPQGIAGVFTWHRGLQFANWPAISRLMCWYAAISLPAAAMGVGAIALVELAFARSAAATATNAAGFFLTISDATGINAWLFYALLLVVGFLVCRKLSAPVRRAFAAATQGDGERA